MLRVNQRLISKAASVATLATTLLVGSSNPANAQPPVPLDPFFQGHPFNGPPGPFDNPPLIQLPLDPSDPFNIIPSILQSLPKFDLEDPFDLFIGKGVIKVHPAILKHFKAELSFKYFELYKGLPIEEELVRAAAMNDPFIASDFFSANQNDPQLKKYSDLFPHIGFMVKLADNLQQKVGETGIRDRGRYLKVVQSINPDLSLALDDFNKTHNLSLECMGIKRTPYEFVFINTFKGKDKKPVCIAIKYPELKETKTKEELTQLLEKKYSELKAARSEQYKIWDTLHEYDLPRDGSLSCVFIGIPGDVSGIEVNFAKLAKFYIEEYKASVSAVYMENMQFWSKALGEIKVTDLSYPVYANKENILDTLGNSLTMAIDKKESTGLDQTVLIQYMMHGNTSGHMETKSGDLVPEDIVEIITAEYKGKPICSQVNIVLCATPSCYSGSQSMGVRTSLKNVTTLDGRSIPVKKLILVNDSTDTTSWCNTTIDCAGLINDSRQKGTWSPTSLYYFSLYYDLMRELKEEGIELTGPMGKFSHAWQFADSMIYADKKHRDKAQDLQMYEHSIDEDGIREKGRYFSQLSPIPPLFKKTPI